MTDEPLTDEQRDLLERWVDGEAGAVGRRRAESLIDSNPRAHAYVDALDFLGSATAAASEAIDTDALPDARAIADRARSAEPLSDLPLAELAPLLDRDADGEVTAAEAQTVRRLRDARSDVDDYLESTEQLANATRHAFDEAMPEDGLDDLPADVFAAIESSSSDEQPQDSSETVVELTAGGASESETHSDRGADRDDRGAAAAASSDSRDASRTPHPAERSASHSRSFWVGAGVAAAIILSLMALLDISPWQTTPSPDVESKKVVIVDRVEQSPGTSVVVRGRRGSQRASARNADRRGASQSDPTVIWMLPDDDPTSTRESVEASPKSPPPGPDAGDQSDTGPELRGDPEPI